MSVAPAAGKTPAAPRGPLRGWIDEVAPDALEPKWARAIDRATD